MANNINCTCGHSWSKASSSKKDMYVCHICGKDNTMEDGGWLSKFEQGGMTLEQKGDNYGTKPNPNEVDVSVSPDFVGLSYDTTGRNYSPAWGGQFQNGGNLWNTNKTAWVDSIHNARKGDLNFVQRMFDQRAGSIQIPGQPGTSTHYMESGDGKAYPTVVQMPNGKLQYLNQNDKDAAWNYANKTGQFIKFPNDEQAEWYANNGYKKGTNVLKKAMGGSLPGAVGFTYARTINPAPSNGKYAKKTKASAQNGKEMKFYQEGLDFKPNSIAQDGAIVDPMGQWAHPGEVTIIPATDITMEGVDYPVLGISDTGDTQMMYPGEDYDFDGEYVTEYPIMKEGGWLSKYQSGGPLSRSNLETMAALEKDIKNQKARNAQETVSQYTPKPGDQQRMNAAKDAYRAEEAKPLNRAASSRVAAKAMENIVEPMLVMEGVASGLSGVRSLMTKPKSISPSYVSNPYEKSGFNPLGLVDDIAPRIDPIKAMGVEMDIMDMSPLNLIPGYGRKLSGKNQTFRKFGNSLDDVIQRQALSPAGGSKFRMGRDQIVSEGNWAARNQPSENYPGVFEATFDMNNPDANLSTLQVPDRNGVLMVDKAGRRLSEIPLTEPGMSFNRRLPFSTRYVPIDKQKLMNNEFQFATMAPHLQSLAEKYTLGLGAASVLGKETRDTYNKYTIDPVIDMAKKLEIEKLGLNVDKRKDGGWLSKFDTAQKGKTIPKPELTSSNIPYTPITLSTNVKAGTKKPTVTLSSQEEILDEQQQKENENKPIVEKKYENIETVKQDNRTDWQKGFAQKQLANLIVQEAQGTSPFAQTLSSFTPTGYNPEAGKIAAENIGQMTPMMGTTRLFNTVRDPENNPYGIGQGNGFLANTLGTLGLLGDIFDVGAVNAPAIKSAGKYLTEQTPLKNTYKLNPFAFKPTEEMMYRGLGVEGMEDAFQSGVFRAKQDVEPSMVGNFDLSKRFDKAYFSPKFDVADQYGQGYIAEVPRTASDWGKRYSKKEWSQIAQRDIPITEGKILQKDWLRGYKEVPQPSGVATPNLGSAIEQSTPLKNISEIEATSPNVKSSWEPQELPGLHLSSTMEGGPISKIVEPKTGLVNVEQALGIIAKESGGANKASIIKKALGKELPKKMDYNDFRKIVQDQLIPLDKQLVNHSSNYGLGRVGYPGPKRSSFEMAIENNKKAIADLEQQITLKKSLNSQDDLVLKDIKRLEDELAESNNQINISLNELNRLPIENQTLVLSNVDKFGRGSSAHGNPMETLGHVHFIRDAESPDVLTITQMQSDAFQGTHRSMPKSLEHAEFSLQSLENIVTQRNSILESLKKQKEELLINKADKESINRVSEQIDNFTRLIKDQTGFNKLNKVEVENFAQKSLLDKNHQERYLQELVDYAGKRGDINKIRVPTSETAAKVQGYEGIEAEEIIKKYNEAMAANPNYTKEIAEKSNENEIKLINDVLNGKLKGKIYEPAATTILKKYTEQPKVIKKLFGVEPKMVTDSKGNTWYEFDIPNKFKGGKGEIKAFKDGGWLTKYK